MSNHTTSQMMQPSVSQPLKPRSGGPVTTVRATDEASVMLMRIIGLEPRISVGIKSRDTTASTTTEQ